MNWALFHSKKKPLIAHGLPIIYTNNFEIIRENVTKFLGVSLTKTWNGNTI